MRAIIIAAGMGSRLKELTRDKPKCLLQVGDKTILERQIDVFKANGIKDITVVKGYCQEKIALPGLNYYINDNYKHNNILNSLMYARARMGQAFIASYSDIVFGPAVMEQLMREPADIAIVVDAAWEKNYEGRVGHPLDEAEKVVYGKDNQVVEIGKVLSEGVSPTGEFIGMIKCSDLGAGIFTRYFDLAKKEFAGKPFLRAKTFDTAYITDFIQFLVERSVKVKCVVIHGGWQEIDVIGDIEKARIMYSQGGQQ